jgi:virulence factor Mce-like protein
VQKVAPSAIQLAVMAVFALSCFGLLLFLWVSFGGSVPLEAKGYRMNIILPQAQQLATRSDVTISGVDVGTVIALTPASSGETIATLQLQARYAPARTDMRAILRAKSLLGETYVELTPGSRSAPAVPDGGSLGAAQVTPSVQLDEIYRTFNPQTRAALQSWLQASAAGVNGQGAALNAALGELDPFVADLQAATATLQSQDGGVGALVSNAGVTFDALTERAHQLRDLVSVARATFGATAAASPQLAAAISTLPTFEQRSQTAFRRLDEFASDGSPLLTQLAPAEQALTPTLRGLRSLSPSLRQLLAGLGPLTAAAARGLPAVNGVLADLAPLLGALSPVLRNLDPLLAYGDLYQPEVEALFANGAATSEAALPTSTEFPGSTITLHYLRALLGPLNPSTFALQSQRDGSARANAYATPGAFNRLAHGLETLDPSNCARPTPGVSGPPNAEVTQETLGLITALAVAGSGSNGNVAAPACAGQPAQSFEGLTSTFPHLTAAPQ